MSLRKLLSEIDSELDPKAQASANAVLIVQKMRDNANIMKMLGQIYLPTDKYKAIVKFATLLGVPAERFDDFVQQQSTQVKQ